MADEIMKMTEMLKSLEHEKRLLSITHCDISAKCLYHATQDCFSQPSCKQTLFTRLFYSQMSRAAISRLNQAEGLLAVLHDKGMD